MNAGKCDNYCYSERQTQKAGEGGNYCSAAREGKYMFPFLDLNIYPPLQPADSRSAHTDPEKAPSPRRFLKHCPPKTYLPLALCLVHPCHTHTHTHAWTHTQLPNLISGLWCPVSLMIAYFPFSHQATVLPSSCTEHLL